MAMKLQHAFMKVSIHSPCGLRTRLTLAQNLNPKQLFSEQQQPTACNTAEGAYREWKRCEGLNR